MGMVLFTDKDSQLLVMMREEHIELCSVLVKTRQNSELDLKVSVISIGLRGARSS